jgi:ribosomal protein S18 acetylase RimI-like enzyme
VIVSLPMYDLPELRAKTDAFWSVIRDQLELLDVDSPDELTRPTGPYVNHWRDTNLLMSQSCGYPVVRDLNGAVDVVGSFSTVVDEPGQPGWYRSVIICRTDDHRGNEGSESDPLAGFRELGGADARARVLCAANGPDSLSGWISLGAAWVSGDAAAIPTVFVTGGHVSSLAAVQSGAADLASIDSLTFHLLSEVRPEAIGGLRIIGRGPLVAVTPMVTATGGPLAELRIALFEATSAPFTDATTPLGITGFVAHGYDAHEPVAVLAQDALRAFDSTVVLRVARSEDIEHLGPIDLASNRLFVERGHPEFETDESIPADVAHQAIAEGRLIAADLLAADGSSTLVGWALLTLTGTECSLGQLSVHPDVARRGIGSALLGAIIRRVRAAGEPTLVLSTQADIVWNQPWYERFGFEVVPPSAWTTGMQEVTSEQSDDGLDWTTRVHMRLVL